MAAVAHAVALACEAAPALRIESVLAAADASAVGFHSALGPPHVERRDDPAQLGRIVAARKPPRRRKRFGLWLGLRRLGLRLGLGLWRKPALDSVCQDSGGTAGLLSNRLIALVADELARLRMVQRQLLSDTAPRPGIRGHLNHRVTIVRHARGGRCQHPRAARGVGAAAVVARVAGRRTGAPMPQGFLPRAAAQVTVRGRGQRAGLPFAEHRVHEGPRLADGLAPCESEPSFAFQLAPHAVQHSRLRRAAAQAGVEWQLHLRHAVLRRAGDSVRQLTAEARRLRAAQRVARVARHLAAGAVGQKPVPRAGPASRAARESHCGASRDRAVLPGADRHGRQRTRGAGRLVARQGVPVVATQLAGRAVGQARAAGPQRTVGGGLDRAGVGRARERPVEHQGALRRERLLPGSQRARCRQRARRVAAVAHQRAAGADQQLRRAVSDLAVRRCADHALVERAQIGAPRPIVAGAGIPVAHAALVQREPAVRHPVAPRAARAIAVWHAAGIGARGAVPAAAPARVHDERGLADGAAAAHTVAAEHRAAAAHAGAVPVRGEAAQRGGR